MTASALRAALSRLGLSQAGAARHVGVDERTMRRWVQGASPIPKLLALHFAALERHGETPADYEGVA